jgi:putative FmdB family regulatory protein
MPHYDYECEKCGYRFEAFQGITDKPLSRCPECEGSLKRLIGPGAGLIFKGNGFYATDYKKSQSSKAASGESCGESRSCPACPQDPGKGKKK